jgi:hypothetical protein
MQHQKINKNTADDTTRKVGKGLSPPHQNGYCRRTSAHRWEQADGNGLPPAHQLVRRQ